MPHIEVDPELPGIRALLAFRPEVARPLGELANILLKSDDGLSPADRELIGAHVSWLNDCFYCRHSHPAIACEYLDGNKQLVEQVTRDFERASISGKLKSLLRIAASVQRSGKEVTEAQVEEARSNGATDRDIHDTVLIAALFSLFNRYVDGLAANTPMDLAGYPARAKQVVEHGYTGPQMNLKPLASEHGE